jgi:hypothetical protein
MECSDVWIAATGKFNLRWNVTQLVVHKVPDSGAEFAFRGLSTSTPVSSSAAAEEDSNQVDDEEEASTLRPASVLASVLPPPAPAPASAPADEEDDGEEAPAPVPVKITKKKPVVIAKRA